MSERRKITGFLICVALVINTTAFGGQPTTSPSLQEEWDRIAANVANQRTIDDQRLLESPRQQQVPLFEQGLASDSRRLRGYCYLSLVGIARREADTLLAKRATRSVLDALVKEPDEMEVGDTAENMAKLPKSAFDAQSLAIIQKLFLARSDRNELCLLAGLADAPEVRQKLNAMRDRADRGGDRQTQWFAGLALARLGEPGMAQRIVDGLRKNGDEKVHRYLNLCVYIRQKEVLPLLVEYLNREGPPHQPGSDYFPEPYAVSALAVLQQIVRDLPASKRPTIEPADIQTAREWFKAHPEPEIIP